MPPAPASLAALSELAARLRSANPAFPAGCFGGRGIVVAAGGVTTFTNAYVLLSMLRQTLGSTLPIEVWHLGSGEMSPTMAALAEELQVTVVDALPRIAAAGADIRDGWQLKCFALMHSAFAEALLLDADQVPLHDPAVVFDWPQYRETGAVFWPDVVDLRRDNIVWSTLGLEPRRTRSMESGQVLVDKQRHWRALSATLALNERAEDLYELIYGDKDTFLLGWELTGSSFYMIEHPPYRDERLLLQRDPDGAPLFQHRTNAKWRYGGKQGVVEGFRYEAECLAALDRLRARWGGRIFYPPDRRPAARQMEAQLAGHRHRLEQAGEGAVELELLAHGEFGDGRSSWRQAWWCTEDSDGVGLVFSDGSTVSCRFLQHGPHWVGTSLFDDGAAVFLAPVDVPAEASGPGLADALLRAVGPRPASDAERAQLTAAATLLARVDPAFAARLQHLLASRPELATAFPGLLAAVLPGANAREVHRRADWSNGYQQANEPDA